MTWHTGRSVETVQAELRAVEARATPTSHPALHAHLSRLREEHAEASRVRRREVEDDLMTMPGDAHRSGHTPAPDQVLTVVAKVS